jgi:hypothetical protein
LGDDRRSGKRQADMSPKNKIAVIGSISFSQNDFIGLSLEGHWNQIIGISRPPEKGLVSPSGTRGQIPVSAHIGCKGSAV